MNNLAASQIESQARQFGIIPVAWSILPSDQSSLVVKLETISGSYVLKKNRPETTLRHLVERLNARTVLRENGFEYLPPPVDDAHEELITEDEGRLWTLARYLEADAPFDWTVESWSRSHCEEAARVMSALHSCSHRALRNGWKPALPEVSLAQLEFMLVELDEKFRYMTGAIDAEHLFGAQFDMGRIIASVTSAIDQLKKITVFDPVMVHGDFHPGNILFGNGKALALLDLEYASTGSPVVDLSYAVIMFFAGELSGSLINRHGARDFVRDYKEFVGGARIDLSCAEAQAEFEHRCMISSFLMILWAVRGMQGLVQSELDGDLADSESTHQFIYGARLGASLIRNNDFTGILQ